MRSSCRSRGRSVVVVLGSSPGRRSAPRARSAASSSRVVSSSRCRSRRRGARHAGSTSSSSAGRFASSTAGSSARASSSTSASASTAGGEQGLLGLAFDPKYATNRFIYVNYTDTNGDTRVVRYRTNGTRAIPGDRARAPRHRPAVREPQRRRARVRPGRRPVRRHGRRRVGRRSREPRAEHGQPARQDAAPGRAPAGIRAGDRRARPAQPVALLVRPAHRRPLHRRRRPGRCRRGRLHAALERRARELRLGPVRGLAPLRGEGCRPRRSSCSPSTSTPTSAAARSWAGMSIAGRRARPSAGGTPSATTARGVWSLRVGGRQGRRRAREPFKIPSLTSFGEDAAGELYATSHEGVVYRIS